MKGPKERPPIATMADIQAHYSLYSKHFTGVRNDLNRLISLQIQTTEQLTELTGINRKILDQLSKFNRGLS